MKDLLRLTRHTLVHKFIPLPQAMKFPYAKAAEDNGTWKKSRKKKKKKGGYSRSTKREQESPLCYTDGHICHLKNAELEHKFQKYEGRIVPRGDIVKDDSGANAFFLLNRARLRPK